MLLSIAYLAKDPDINLDHKRYETAVASEIPCRVDTEIMINGYQTFRIETQVNLLDMSKACYKVFKNIAQDAVVRAADRDADGTFSDSKTIDEIYKNGKTSDFWQIVHSEHLKEDLPKFPPEAKHVYDFDVSVMVNGYMLYHGWMLFGSSQPAKCNEVPAIVQGLLQDMSNRVDSPSKEDLMVIFKH